MIEYKRGNLSGREACCWHGLLALVAQATVMGIDDAFMIATLLRVISLVLAFFIRNTIPEKDA